jgi:CBS domain containing-hemolysin-like protein
LILNTSAHTIGASIAGSQFDELWGDEWIWLFSLVFTFAMLQFTEILPKGLGVRFNRKLASYIAGPLSAMVHVSLPLIKLVHWVNAPFNIERAKPGQPSTTEEIRALASMARLSSEISGLQEYVIRGASRLSQTKIRQVMIPVEQVSFLSTSQSLEQALTSAENDSHTRFPVCKGIDRCEIVGYVNFKDMVTLARKKPDSPSIESVLRSIPFISPDDSVADRLRTFIEQHIHIAAVKDEKGQVLGLVTLEDLLEEVVGEVEDEFDRLPRDIQQVPPNTWIAGGGVPISQVAVKLEINLTDPEGNLSRWLGTKLKQPYKSGQAYIEADHTFTVRRIRRGHIFDVIIQKQNLSLRA